MSFVKHINNILKKFLNERNKEESKSYLYSHDTEVAIVNILVFILLVIMYKSHIYINKFHIFLYVMSYKAIIILHMQFCEPFIYLTTSHKHLLMSLNNFQEYNLKRLRHFLISCICYKLFNQSHNTRHFFPVATLVQITRQWILCINLSMTIW